MPYVSRDEVGTVSGLFANLQPGYAEEYLPDDDPEVVAFLNPPPVPPVPTNEQLVLVDHENRIRSFEGLPPLTALDFINKMANPVKDP